MRKSNVVLSVRSSRVLSSLMVPGVLASAIMVLFGACSSEPAKAPAPAPVAAPAAPLPAAPAAAGDGAAGDAGAKKSKLAPAPTDGLSLAERMERRKADEAKLAAQLAGEERKRLMAWDKTKVKLHTEVFTFIKKTRATYDAAKTKEEVDKLKMKMEKSIVATGKKLQKIDPKGGNSNVVTDYDVMLNALAEDYPQALAASMDGLKPPLIEQRAEMDKRTKKIEDWLAAIKAGK
jgi:hypothetical protein